MAFITSTKAYVKLFANGDFLVYKNKAARAKEKKATPAEEVLKAYERKLAEYLIPSGEAAEREYYDRDAFNEEFDRWQDEAWRYMSDLKLHNVGGEYPLMAEIIPDVAESIPEILASGNIGITNASAKEEYEAVKKLNLFPGGTKDA